MIYDRVTLILKHSDGDADGFISFDFRLNSNVYGFLSLHASPRLINVVLFMLGISASGDKQ